MTSDSIEQDSIRSVSPIVMDHYVPKKLFAELACCRCARKPNGFFQRIEIFKGLIRHRWISQSSTFLYLARKRQSTVRKQYQQQANLSNGNACTEIDRFSEEQHFLPIEVPESPLMRTTRSISFLHPTNSPRPFSQNLDTCSFADIEVASSTNERKSLNHAVTPKSTLSHNISSMTTSNLSACSTQSLLRKLLDKAQCLDEYYKDLSHPPRNHRWTFVSTSSNSDRTSSSLFQPRPSSSQRSDSSRFDLYPDEDNILRELVRFNTDINLILSRLSNDDPSNNQQAATTTTETIIDPSNVDTQVHSDP